MISDRKIYNQAIYEEQKRKGYKRVNVTLDPQEFQEISTHAKKYGKKVTTHLKDCAIGYVRESYLVPPDIESRLDELVLILRGVGNNINQLARYSNEMRYFLETEAVRSQVRKLEEEIRKFLTEPPKQK